MNPGRALKAPGCDLGHRNPVLGVKQFRELGEANFLGHVTINRAVTQLMSEVGFGPTAHIGSTAPMYAVDSLAYKASRATPAQPFESHIRTASNLLL